MTDVVCGKEHCLLLSEHGQVMQLLIDPNIERRLEIWTKSLDFKLHSISGTVSLPCRSSYRVIKANCPSKLATFMLTPKIGHAKSCLYYCYLISHKCHSSHPRSFTFLALFQQINIFLSSKIIMIFLLH